MSIPNAIKLRIVLLLLLILVIIFLLYLAIIPFGKANYVFIPGQYNSFWGILSPQVRLFEPFGNTQKIKEGPVYINLRTSRPFDRASLKIKYRYPVNSNINIIEAGVLVDSKMWRYELLPLENNFLNRLSKSWSFLIEDGSLFLEKKPEFSSISEFIGSSPDVSKIAFYNYEYNFDYEIPSYEYNSSVKDIDTEIRGPYQFYTYVGEGEDLYFDFFFEDINANNDSDPIDIFLYYKDKLINSTTLEDDGIEEDNNKIGEQRSLSFDFPGMPQGVYKFEVKVNEDIITSRIRRKQSKMSFINKVWIYGDSDGELKMYTDSSDISVLTKNPASLQVIDIDDRELEMNETFKQFNASSESAISVIELKKRDVVMAGNGIFSFIASDLINPSLKKVDINYDLGNEDISYVLAKYTFPQIEDGWKVNTVNIDLTKAYRENQIYSFILSVPGLRMNDEVDDWVEIAEVSVDLEGRSLFQWVKNYLKNN